MTPILFLAATAQAAGPQFSDAALASDDTQSLATRLAAVERLITTADPAVLPVLRAVLRGPDTRLQLRILERLGAWQDAAVVPVLAMVAREAAAAEPVRTAAVDALGALQLTEAAAALVRLASNRELPRELQGHAAEVLLRDYPGRARAEDLQVRADPWGATLGISGAGLTGAVALSSVGVWTRSDLAVWVGSIGGTAVGAGSAGIVNSVRPLDHAEGLVMASGPVWGTAAALALTEGIFPDQSGRTRDNLGAGLRTAGAAGGLGLAAWRWKRGVELADTREVNTTGWLGAQLGAGIGMASASVGPSCSRLDGQEQVPCWEDRWARERRGHMLGAVAGGAVGLGTGALLRQGWAPDRASIALGSVGAVQGSATGLLLPAALGRSTAWHHVDLGLPAGAATALAIDHLVPSASGSAGNALVVGIFGHGLGAGLPLLVPDVPGQTLAASTAGVGLAGTLTGGLVAPLLDLSPGDRTLIGVGSGIAAVESWLISDGLLDAAGRSREQALGIGLTAGSLTGIGLEALATTVEVPAGDVVLVTTVGGWGAMVGVLGPIAAGARYRDGAGRVAASAGGAVGMGIGGVLASPLVGLEPRRTVVPQLCAVGGGSLGTIGAAFATSEQQWLALGAVAGAAVGAAGGVGLELWLGDRRQEQAALVPLPSALASRLPGHWSLSPRPAVLEDGETGVGVDLQVVGW